MEYKDINLIKLENGDFETIELWFFRTYLRDLFGLTKSKAFSLSHTTLGDRDAYDKDVYVVLKDLRDNNILDDYEMNSYYLISKPLNELELDDPKAREKLIVIYDLLEEFIFTCNDIQREFIEAYIGKQGRK